MIIRCFNSHALSRGKGWCNQKGAHSLWVLFSMYKNKGVLIMAGDKSCEEIVTYAKYECLCCGHQDKVQGKRKDYSEVKVCPKCNGAFVDIWEIAKYKSLAEKTKSVGE